jgi:sugar (pentulose or hexulose) kinase
MATPAGRGKLSQAIDPLVLAVDIGSTASRGDVFDAAGRPVQGGREKVPQFNPRDDGTGERSTGWAANARAVFAGVSAATTGAMLLRGAMEGVAMSYARIADQLQSAGRPAATDPGEWAGNPRLAGMAANTRRRARGRLSFR